MNAGRRIDYSTDVGEGNGITEMDIFYVLLCLVLGPTAFAYAYLYYRELQRKELADAEQDNMKLFLLASVKDLQKQLQAERAARQASDSALAQTEEVVEDMQMSAMEQSEREG